MNNIDINCIHESKKTKLRVIYHGVEKIIYSCDSCIEIIEASAICKILEKLSR